MPGTFDTVDVLAPGETAEFSDSVPVELLDIPDEAGVYWIGIHALGDGAVPRDIVADGRARTFIPARPTGRPAAGDGGDPAGAPPGLVRRRGPDQRHRALGRTAGGGREPRRRSSTWRESAGSTPYSWLVDPAVIVALRAAGLRQPAPRRSLPTPTVPDQEPTDPGDPDGRRRDAAPSGDADRVTRGTEEPTRGRAELAVAARAWLDRLRRSSVGTTAGAGPPLRRPRRVRGGAPRRRLRTTRRSPAAPRSWRGSGCPSHGSRSPRASDVLSPRPSPGRPTDVTILLGDNAFSPPAASPRLGRPAARSQRSSSPAPAPRPAAPDPPRPATPWPCASACSARRRSATPTATPRPLVVTLPTVWRGEDAASFFTDLEQPWLEVVDVADVASGSATDVPPSTLVLHRLRPSPRSWTRATSPQPPAPPTPRP